MPYIDYIYSRLYYILWPAIDKKGMRMAPLLSAQERRERDGSRLEITISAPSTTSALQLLRQLISTRNETLQALINDAVLGHFESLLAAINVRDSDIDQVNGLLADATDWRLVELNGANFRLTVDARIFTLPIRVNLKPMAAGFDGGGVGDAVQVIKMLGICQDNSVLARLRQRHPSLNLTAPDTDSVFTADDLKK